MRRGSATGIAEVWARCPTVAAARLGIATLLRDDRILRVMIVRNEVPPAFVEWGGTMNGARQSPPEVTAAFLVHAERNWSPVLIPGAFEKRAAGPLAPLRSRADVVVAAQAHPIVGADVERLEHEREGGGAPSTRAGTRSGTLGAAVAKPAPSHAPSRHLAACPSAGSVNIPNIKVDLPRVTDRMPITRRISRWGHTASPFPLARR
jgi:hypothetical protein